MLATAGTVAGHWKTSVNVGALVTMVAAVHYMYMRAYLVAVHARPVDRVVPIVYPVGRDASDGCDAVIETCACRTGA